MQFNADTNGQDLVTLMNDATNMDDVEWPLTKKARDANMALRSIWGWIHEAYGGWLYDDSNNTSDFPTATAPLVLNQKDYSIPSEALTIRGVEVRTPNNGSWQKLGPKTEEQIRDIIAEKQFLNVPSAPMFYTPYANSIRIYPAANYAQTASIRVSYDRSVVIFLPTDTNKQPGFISLFHEAVAIGAALLFGMRKSLPVAVGTIQNKKLVPGALQSQWSRFETDIKKFYSKRYKQFFPDQISVHDATTEAM